MYGATKMHPISSTIDLICCSSGVYFSWWTLCWLCWLIAAVQLLCWCPLVHLVFDEMELWGVDYRVVVSIWFEDSFHLSIWFVRTDYEIQWDMKPSLSSFTLFRISEYFRCSVHPTIYMVNVSILVLFCTETSPLIFLTLSSIRHHHHHHHHLLPKIRTPPLPIQNLNLSDEHKQHDNDKIVHDFCYFSWISFVDINNGCVTNDDGIQLTSKMVTLTSLMKMLKFFLFEKKI